MPFPIPELRAEPAFEPPIVSRPATREDVLWDRPIFQAPLLVLHLAPSRPSPHEMEPTWDLARRY